MPVKTYVFGQMKLTKNGNRFTLEGNVMPNQDDSDHFQLIYEALEIAAHSQDIFSSDFADMCAEFMNMSVDWID